MPQLAIALKCSMVNAATFGVPLGGPRSAMSAARVGEHSAVEWNWV